MTSVVQRRLNPQQVPVHVLIVVVGLYLNKADNLPRAGAFAQTVVDFWRDGGRVFPGAQALESVDVLASDQAGPVSITGDGAATVVDPPGYPSVKSALLDWVGRITATEGAVGFLHWIGHGREQVRGGSVVTLFCHGPKVPKSREQAGLNWTTSLHVINEKTVGHPVYCFIDACRTRDTSELDFDGIGPCNWGAPENAYVFVSSAKLTSAYWITQLTPAASRAGCEEQALGTRAFMAGMSGFGARQGSGPHMAVTAPQLVEASQALVGRWARHQGVVAGLPEGPPGGDPLRPILLTADPKSTVDVVANGMPSHSSCEAQPAGSVAVLLSETAAAPFEFRLSRKRHKFRFSRGAWDAEQDLVHPHMQLYDHGSP